MEIEVRQVWSWNLKQEMSGIVSALRYCPFIAMDTEFPGFIMQSSRNATHEEIYSAMKFNVDQLKLIQVGLALFDEAGNLFGFCRQNRGCVWQFNLCDFDAAVDRHCPNAIELLTKSGIDFEASRRSGIDSRSLCNEFWAAGLVGNCRLRWLCFHGNYDMGYLLKLVRGGRPLPSTRWGFLCEISRCFFNVYDLKYMARFYSGLKNGELGLRKLVGILQVEKFFKEEEAGERSRCRQYHQSGWDSLVTGMAFFQLKKKAGKQQELKKNDNAAQTEEVEGCFQWVTVLNYSRGVIFGLEDMRIPLQLVPTWSSNCSRELTRWNYVLGCSSHGVARW